jgi:cellulose synthase/poly-beta-1,6-N-acetylglucosamine synthase-like glycosyltransferase
MIPVVIPYYRNRKRLRRCRKHLKNQTVNGRIEVHVVNDSRQGSGYTRAVNRGLRHFLARPNGWDYIVVLDQDMYLDTDAIENFVKFMDSHPRCGVAVSLQRLYDRPSFVQGGGLDCIPTGVVEEMHLSYFERDAAVFWGDIAGCMIRKECLWDIGLLDENFYFVCSDSDFTLTARSKGWEVWVPSEVRGVHQRGEAAPVEDMEKNPPRLLKQIGNDIALFRQKWENSGYYRILKYEPHKPACVIRHGEVVGLDGKKLIPKPHPKPEPKIFRDGSKIIDLKRPPVDCPEELQIDKEFANVVAEERK